jgi:serine protease AprX
MIKILLLLLVISTNVYSQVNDAKVSTALKQIINHSSDNKEILVWVFFTDKGEQRNLLNTPDEVVSIQSLKRRSKVFSEQSLISEEDLPLSSEYIEELEAAGFNIKQKTKWFNGVSGYIYKSSLPKITSLKFVREVDVVCKLKNTYQLPGEDIQMKTTEPEEVYAFNYGQSLTQMQQINVPALHNLQYYGQGITIAVMDAGFNRLSHEVFANMNIIARWDFVNNDPGVGDSSDMGSGSHGTQTLSAIGGFKEGQLIGPAFQANFILAKTENTDSETPIEEDNWIAALEWADSIGVDVTSTSLGYLGYDSPYPSYTWQNMNGNTAKITIAADLAVKKGIVVLNSAGNSGFNSTRNTLSAPADGDSVIAVGAVTSSGTRSSFSSVGPTVDGRIKPDIMAMGSSVRVASPYSNTGYQSSDGTSFSCPLAAGVAALVLCVNPELTPMQVRDALRNTASKNNNPDNLMGWGIINAVNASNYFPIPVELVSFSAEYQTDYVFLKWVTATEKNNMGFEIQRSTQGEEWLKIGFVPGAGTSTEINNYSFVDHLPLTSTAGYRLKQLDYDGQFNYSNIVYVEPFNVTEFILTQNYPNPFNPVTKIKFAVPQSASGTSIQLKVYDILGKEVALLLNEPKVSGEYEVEFDGSSLSGGVYFYSLTAGSYSATRKLVLLK